MKHSLATAYAVKKHSHKKSYPAPKEPAADNIEPDGMPEGSDILKGIIKRKKMAEGGLVNEPDQDDFLSEDMTEEPFEEMSHLDVDESEPMDDSKKTMAMIMERIRKRK